MPMRRFRGRRTVMSFRLCSRAPWTTSSSAAILASILPGRTDVRLAQLALLEQPGDAPRHAFDLELAGDDGAVAEDPAEQRPLDLEHRAVERDRRAAAPQESVLDHERASRDDEVRPIPARDREYGLHCCEREQHGARNGSQGPWGEEAGP